MAGLFVVLAYLEVAIGDGMGRVLHGPGLACVVAPTSSVMFEKDLFVLRPICPQRSTVNELRGPALLRSCMGIDIEH